jgi:hypothetical protein
VRDISTSGLFVVTQHPLELGTTYAATLKLPGKDEWSVRELELRLKITRAVTGLGYGSAFVEPSAELVAAIEAR